MGRSCLDGVGCAALLRQSRIHLVKQSPCLEDRGRGLGSVVGPCGGTVASVGLGRGLLPVCFPWCHRAEDWDSGQEASGPCSAEIL